MSNATILVVEDEGVVAMDLQKRLTNVGYEVVGVATTGEEAIKKAEETRPDLALMDIMLQGDIDGIQTAQRLRARFDIPVVFLSAYSDLPTLNRAKVTEPFGYLLKPFKERELLTTIETALYKCRMERRLKESERKLATTLLSIGDAVIATDEKGKVTFMNRVAEALTGWSESLARGQDLGEVFNIISEETRETIENPVEKALRHGLTADLANHTLLISRDGTEFPIEDSASPIKDDNGNVNGVVLVFKDITGRKQAEEALRRSEEQLRQAQKIEAIGRLAGGVAHDFNNLMTVVVGYSELLLKRTRKNDPDREELGEIQKAGERAAVLTSQLLAFSRRQILQPRILDLNHVIADMEKMLRRFVGEHVNFETSLDPSLRRIKADPGQIEQVIMNLATNARDAMPEGGRLMIETANVHLDRESAGVKPGDYARLSIADTGLGMNSETLSKIFEPFFTTKETGKGTGLGLAVVDGIVKQSDGYIEVHSRPGQGTTFSIYLPRNEDMVIELDSPIPAVLPADGRGTILVVEDERAVRNLVGNILATSGYRVIKASRGREAIEICRQYEGDIDLMITDVVMPGTSGRQLAERIRTLRPRMRVLFMSGYTDDIMDKQMALIEKPFSPDSLVRKVGEVLETGGQAGIPS